MEERIRYYSVAPDAVKAMRGVQAYVDGCGLEHSLLELVKLRASQINGCAYCVDLHTRDARKAGETERRLYAVAVWEEAPFFTARERAALAWTEAVTLIARDHVPDAVYEEAREEFSEKELVDLTMAIVAINGWNRIAVSFRQQPEMPKSTQAAQ
ncbi:MAG TPA: carboxymuconolactone decarboxylase family protein [Alphaproteobacteria bacterium]|nr:carboxymuconolactone decarboxylase family protein [Alphaproteobacteria bacterium]